MIEQETYRKGMHLAQVLQKAIREKNQHVEEDYPERKYVDEMKLKSSPTKGIKIVAVLGIICIASTIVYKLINNK